MLKSLTIKNRMYLIIGLILILFAIMAWFSYQNNFKVGDLAMVDTEKAMLDGQKEKLQVATNSIALAVGEIIKKIDDEQEKINVIRQAVENIRFESDKSGYFFVYKETTVLALPPKKSLVGKDLKDAESKGVFFVRELRDAAKKGGGFVQYIFAKPNAGDVMKLGYAEMIPGTEFWIGTGVYLDNIDAYKADMKD